MKRKIGFISAIGGTISMILGFVGLCMVFPFCGAICIGGIAAAILGVGVIGFLNKYGIWFTVIGGLISFLGIFLIIKCRKKCDKSVHK